VQPALSLFETVGVDTSMIPDNFNVPSGPSWYRLIRWLLDLGEALPSAAIPEVVDLYTAWSVGMMGIDPLTPMLLQQLYGWLTEIETAREAETFRDRRAPFGDELSYEEVKSLEYDLRNGFLMFCNRTPALTVEYLQSLRSRRSNDHTVDSILLKFRGRLAQAAPAELAELTIAALIPEHPSDERHKTHRPEEPFEFLDRQFFPASPVQGPFLDLLNHAPKIGLMLIRRIVDHAISFYSRGAAYGANAFIIAFPEGDRAFPWTQSYTWSRETQGPNCVAAAMMALEAWAHRRIEAGESFDMTLSDVLGPADSPAAFLLIAVDLLLSHWPKSRESAVPFLACPELLCIDRQRLYVLDKFEVLDYFGHKGLQKESLGAAELQDLKKRASRKLMLDELLGQYALSGSVETREALNALLRRASARLGPPEDDSDLGDPNFMAVHAINLIDPNNWHQVSVTLTDGRQGMAYEYISPEAEGRHFATLQEKAKDSHADRNIQAAISLALDDPHRSSPKFAAEAVEWAQNEAITPKSDGADEDWMREQSIVIAAMILMRDGDADLRARNEKWARDVFARALQTKEDRAHRFRSGLRYNSIAIAFAGMIHALKDRACTEDVRGLIEVAAQDNPAAAHGLGAAATMLTSIDERLPRAILRCAFVACIRQRREWDIPEEEVAVRTERDRQLVQEAVDAELGWLANERPEPDWPAFPAEEVRRRRGIRIGGGREWQDVPIPRRPRPDVYIDWQAVALWLKNAGGIVDVVQRPWIRDIIRAYGDWTATANGAGLEAHEEVDHPPSEWNEAYFDLMAHCLPGMGLTEIEEFALQLINSLPDEAFFDAVTEFLRSVDDVYFNERGIEERVAVSIRLALANRMMASRGWKRLAGSRSTSIEIHIGPAIAVLFFNEHSFVQSAKCYLFEKGIDRIDPFLSTLVKLVTSGASYFVAIVTLNLLEVSPRPAHLPFMVEAAKTWMENYPDDCEFWVDHDIGHRICLWIENVRRQDTNLLNADKAVRLDVDRLLAALVSLGVAAARRLEEVLAKGSGSRT